MAQAPADIEQHILATRARLDNDVGELQQRVREQLDWRLQIERHPWGATTGALAAGFLISMWFTRLVGWRN